MRFAKFKLFFFQLLVISAQVFAEEEAIVLIGASWANGHVPFNQDLVSPLSGEAVARGSYLDLGSELIRNNKFVINEAQAGSTTFKRPGCDSNEKCGPGYWDSYETQLDRAIKRIADLSGSNLSLNARYVYISNGNDCFHPNAFGVPWNQTSPCTTMHFNQLADRLIAVGQKAIDNGLTPIFSKFPEYTDLDLPHFRDTFGFDWVLEESGYNEMRDIVETRITNELPAAIYLNVWEKFVHIGDGLHPDADSVKNAARVILNVIEKID